MLMRPWAWCRDHTYTVIWTEHGQRERRGEPHLTGGAQSECGQASHCVQGCRGEHYAVVMVSFRKGQGWELSGTIGYNYCCWRVINYKHWSRAVFVLRFRVSVTVLRSYQLEHRGQGSKFRRCRKMRWTMNYDPTGQTHSSFSGPVLQYSWLVQSCEDNKCIRGKISLDH